MRLTTGLILLAALAGCGSGQKANNAATAAPAANASAAPAPAAPANRLAGPAPAAPAASVAEFREETFRGCVEGGNESAPPGTPIEQICTCATDRAMAGRSLAELEAEPTADFERRFRGTVDACVDEAGG